MEVNICRLCLNLVKKDFEVIDELIRQMLEVLLLKVDLNISKSPLICQNCAEIIKKSYFFKSACADAEELIHSFSVGNSMTELDMKDIYKDSKDVKTVANEDLNICRFCINQIGKNNFISMDDLMYAEMLPIYLPNTVINIVKNPVICTSCRESLECYFQFVQQCLDIEEKINKYRHSQGTNSMSQIELNSILPYLFKDTLESSDKWVPAAVIKQENKFEYEENNVECEVYDVHIKREAPLDIEDTEPYRTPSETDMVIVKCEPAEANDSLEIDKGSVHNCKSKHKGSSSNVKISKCEICVYETTSKRNLKRHLLIHKDVSEVEMHKCCSCPYETIFKDYLKKHMVIHKDESEVAMYKCESCTYKTKYKENLRRHIVLHKDVSEVEMHKCELCTYETKCKNNLTKHKIVHKGTSEVEMHKCDICTYETKCKTYLKRHGLLHKDTSEVEMHKCGLCTYETKFKPYLKKHIMKKHKDTMLHRRWLARQQQNK